MEKSFETDVAIIGAGPVGLFAIFECGMLGLKTHVIDSLAEIGGQCTALYPEKPIYDIPAWPEISAGALIEKLETQAAPFEPVYHLDQKVTHIKKQSSYWQLRTSKDTIIQAQAIIIAGGNGSFGPNRPPLDNIESYEGTSVFYMVRHKADFNDKRIVIAGGGDSAVDWALSLYNNAAHIYLVHRRAKFRAAPNNVEELHKLAESDKLDLIVPYQLDSLDGTNGKLQNVRVRSTNDEIIDLPADILLPFFGLANDLGPIADWNLDLDRQFIITNPLTSATNMAGIYAIGDIVSYDNKLKLILTGFAEAAQAAHAIYQQIHPEKELHMEYSTSKGLPS